MAELSTISAFPSPTIPSGQHRGESPPRTRHGHAHRSSPDQSLGGDVKQISDAILLKTALEGLDFQSAREEVLTEQAQQPADPQRVDQAPLRTLDSVEFSVQATQLHVEASHLTVDISTPEASLHLEVTHVEASLTQVSFTGGAAPKKQDPLVLDFNGAGPETTGAEGARSFDLAGNGQTAPTSFVTGGSAFLALDRNGNGRIDDGTELFGDQHGASDGYEELTKFDQNRDGLINPQDRIYSSLRLLFGDGRTNALADAGVAAISLSAAKAPATTEHGDDILRRATASLANGSTINTYALGLQRFDSTT